METVRIERQDGVATVTIDDGAGNRIGRDLCEALRKAALKLSDTPPNAIILQGRSDFSLGLAGEQDPMFEAFRTLVANRDAFRAQEIVQRYRNALDGFARLPCPVVVAIEGACIGPALGLALSADLRIAGISARFGPQPIKTGVLPGFGTLSRLAARVGADRITEVVLTSGDWDAAEALSLGIADRVVPDGTALDEARELVASILEGPTTTRLQTLVTLRALRAKDDTHELEAQAAARTWVRGEWQSS